MQLVGIALDGHTGNNEYPCFVFTSMGPCLDGCRAFKPSSITVCTSIGLWVLHWAGKVEAHTALVHCAAHERGKQVLSDLFVQFLKRHQSFLDRLWPAQGHKHLQEQCQHKPGIGKPVQTTTSKQIHQNMQVCSQQEHLRFLSGMSALITNTDSPM